PAENLCKHPVEPIEQCLVLHEGGARQIIEILGGPPDHLAVEHFEQDQMLLERHRDARGAQFVEKGNEHPRLIRFLGAQGNCCCTEPKYSHSHCSGGDDVKCEAVDDKMLADIGQQCGALALRCSETAGFISQVSRSIESDHGRIELLQRSIDQLVLLQQEAN